jgi:uncharacterized Rmd1/YagE family protein
MLRRCNMWRCALTTSDLQRVTAWFAHSPLNLDKLEGALRDAGVGSLRRVSSKSTPSGKRIPKRDDVLMFAVDGGAEGRRTPLLEELLKPAVDCCQEHSKTFIMFPDGTVVGWNASARDLAAIVGEGTEGNVRGHSPVSESLKFRLGTDTFVDVDSDTIVLASGKADLKLPFSFVLAQSLKLDVVDTALKPVLVNVKFWQKDLGRSGHMACSVKQLRKTKANLLAVYDDMDFTYNVQTTPKLFWLPEYQQLRAHYKSARNHLEIDGRLEVLADRAETVNEALDYLSSEVHSEAIEFLTWVIIWLIMFEICLGLDLDHKLLNLLGFG